MLRLSRLMWLIAAISLFTGCTTAPRKQEAPPQAVIEAPAPPPANFNIPAGMLDTWNAIGQLLVRMEGVTYHGRAQKLGLYDVEYRGERFLILTQALWLSSDIKVTTTQVRAALQDGKPNSSAPAIELLGMLQARLPAELIRIASEKKRPPVKKAVVKKKTTAKPAVRH
ncbi:MAG: hypothetical protein ACREPB_09265 [Arenimonas sp.]